MEKQAFERTKELTKARILDRRRKRRTQILWHVAVCSSIVIIFLSVVSVMLHKQAQEYAVGGESEMTQEVESELGKRVVE